MGNKESKTLLMQSDLSSKNKLESEKSPSPKSSSQTIHTCVSSYTNDQSTNNSISKAVLHTSEETLHIRPRSAEKEVETINSIIQKQTKFIKKKSNYQKPNERKNVTLPWVRIKGRKSVTFVKNDSAGLYAIKEDTKPEEVKRRKSMFSRRDSVKVKPQRDMLWTQRYPNLDEISPSIVYPNDFTKRKQYCYIMSILSVQDDMKCLIRNNLKLMEKHDSQSNNQFESNIMHPSPNKFYSLSHLFTCYIQDCELCRENAVIPDPIIKINPSIHTQMLQKFVDCTYALFNINANIRRNNLHIIHDLISNPKKIKKIVKAHVQFNLNKNLVEGEAGLPSTDNDLTNFNLVNDFVLTLYRLFKKSPYKIIVENANTILEKLKNIDCRILPYFENDGPSTYIDKDKLEHPWNENNIELKNFYLTQYMNQRRLTNVQEIMYFHPSYSCQFINLETFLMSDCGPLLKTYRHYIAIIAAARHKCKYLVELYTLNFLKCGGDQKWLTSIKNTPLKLQNIQEVNKILAHKPWMINKCHIYNLRHAQKGDSWSTSEMLQALIIMVHFHSLSSFVYGTGVAFESDTPSSHSFYIHDKFSVEGFENLPDNAADGNESKTKRENLQSKNLFKLDNLIDDLTYKYTDFKKCGEPADMHTLRFQDFSWNKEGYSLCSLYPNSGRLLDSKFNAIKDLTYTQISNVNNNDFYTAIMRYLQSIYGLRYDDYNYSEINILLNRELKSTIKIVGCLPEEMTKEMTKEMYNKFMYGFEDAEKVLVNIIIMEARVECSLLYALKAVNKYISSN